MSEFEKLYDLNDEWEATRIVVDRTRPSRKMWCSVLFEKGDDRLELKFDCPDEIESIIDLIDFEYFKVSKLLGSQKEFGTIRIEYFCEGYTELWCDSVVEITPHKSR